MMADEGTVDAGGRGLPSCQQEGAPPQSDIKSKAFSYLKAGPRLSLGQFLQILNVIKRADFRAKSSVLAEK